MYKSNACMMLLGNIMLNNKVFGYRVFNIRTNEVKNYTDYQLYEMLKSCKGLFTNIEFDYELDSIKYKQGKISNIPQLDAISRKVIDNRSYWYVIGKIAKSNINCNEFILKLVNTDGKVVIASEENVIRNVKTGKIHLVNAMVRGFRGSDKKHVLGNKHTIPKFELNRDSMKKAS